MIKIIILVTILQHLLLQADSYYLGDSCEYENQQGSCIPVEQCKPIHNEVIKAGNPIPSKMMNKLQSLHCGFDVNVYLICCISLETTTQGLVNRFATTPKINIDNPISTDSLLIEDDDIERHPNINLLPKECGYILDDRIVGGDKTELFEMPWMVLLSYDTRRGMQFGCGGTIINERYILTAAHCVSFLDNERLTGVILGEYDITQDPDCVELDGEKICAPKVINATIESIVAHPGYTPQTLRDDIALIRLSSPIDFTLDSVQPICLPITRELQMQSLVGQRGKIAGWGVTEQNTQSDVLLSVEITVISLEQCQDSHKNSSTEWSTQVVLGKGQLCAFENADKKSCKGDSGGPLMYPGKIKNLGVHYVQRGIVSFGHCPRNNKKKPEVHTNVAQYMGWILNQIRN